MTYETSLRSLTSACSAAGIVFHSRPVSALNDFIRSAFPASLLLQIELVGYPGDCEIPWIVEDLYLYGFGDIESRQAGYRIDVRTRHIVEGWDANRYVIADWSANPVVIGDDGRIAFAFHGMGSWKYQTIADDLPSFFGLLAAWIRYFVINHDGRLFDANSDLHEETIAEVIQITTDLKGVHQNEAVNFLLGMR